jgi:LAO/AO transport system kinase
MVDMFVVLVSPGGGDELQGIKRGIMELADLVVVTKADGDLIAPAKRAAAEYGAALHLLRPKWKNWTAEIRLVSSTEGHGIGEVWSDVERFHGVLSASGDWDAHRRDQRVNWLWSELREGLLATLSSDAEIARDIARIEASVANGETAPVAAARELLARFRGT